MGVENLPGLVRCLEIYIYIYNCTYNFSWYFASLSVIDRKTLHIAEKKTRRLSNLDRFISIGLVSWFLLPNVMSKTSTLLTSLNIKIYMILL